MAVARREAAPAEASGREQSWDKEASPLPAVEAGGGEGWGLLGISCLEKQTSECSDSRSHVSLGQSLGDQTDMSSVEWWDRIRGTGWGTLDGPFLGRAATFMFQLWGGLELWLAE